MFRRSTRAAEIGVRRRCSALRQAVETLETRRLFNASFEYQHDLVPPTPDASLFGAPLVVSGNHAMLAQLGDGFSVDGRVHVWDTTTGQLVRTFTNPGLVEDGFAASATMVGERVVIAAAQTNSLYVYDNLADLEPTVLTTADFGVGGTGFIGFGMAEYQGDLLLQLYGFDVPTNAVVARYDFDAGATTQVYTAPAEAELEGAVLFGDMMRSSGDQLFIQIGYFDGVSAFTAGIVQYDTDTAEHVRTYKSPNVGVQDGWGTSFDVEGTNLVVGALGTFAGVEPMIDGTVYHYETVNGTLVQTFVSPDPSLSGLGTGFGWGVAVRDGVLYAGSMREDYVPILYGDTAVDEVRGSGAVYAFDLADGSLLAQVNNPLPAEPVEQFTETFGAAVAVTADGSLVVYDPNDDTRGEDLGAISVYRLVTEQQGPLLNPLAGPAAGVRAQALSFVGSFTDAADAAGYEVSWDFGDGTVTAFAPASASMLASHAYASAGDYTVTMTVRDGDGVTTSEVLAVSITATLSVDGNLVVGGTSGSDAVSVVPGSGGTALVYLGTTVIGSVGAGQTITIYGGDGVDVILAAGSIQQNLIMIGGAGIDILRGGAGDDAMVGGDGLDLLIGGGGRDVLIGGNQSDRIVGNTDDDILIAGSTAFDNDPAALAAIVAEWSSSRTYAERVANLRGTGSGASYDARLNGDLFLRADAQTWGAANVTVYDDGATDLLTGSAGTDWFIFNADSGVRDYATDLKAAEFSEDLDIINYVV